MMNSGQSCNAPTRLLVPLAQMDEAKAAERAVLDRMKSFDGAGRRS